MKNKAIKIFTSILLIVVSIFAPIFTESTHENEMIFEWETINNSLHDTTWKLDKNIETPIEITYKTFTLTKNSTFKSYMPYKAFSKSSKQYLLQQYATTDENGFRRINDYYIVAVGTHYFEDINTCIGTYIDIVLENGEVIKCIVGDIKADEHTDSANIVTLHNGCVSEFIVNTKVLDTKVKRTGDVSYLKEEWMSPVEKIVVYERNVFDE